MTVIVFKDNGNIVSEICICQNKHVFVEFDFLCIQILIIDFVVLRIHNLYDGYILQLVFDVYLLPL